jgi:hypothetical protein
MKNLLPDSARGFDELDIAFSIRLKNK